MTQQLNSERPGQAIINYICLKFLKTRPDLQGKGNKIDMAVVNELYNMSALEFETMMQVIRNSLTK